MKWLADTLELAGGYINLGNAGDRQLLAEAIIDALPRSAMADAIRRSATAVLSCHQATCSDGAGAEALAQEIGNNATQIVLAILHVGPDSENQLAIPEALEL